MYSAFTIALKYLRYYFTAKNGKGHGVHSPFVFQFITSVLNDHRQFYAYQSIEEYRNSLLSSNKMLNVDDFGAGSVVSKSRQRRIGDIARSALKPPKFGQLFFRMVNHYTPQTIVELGTSLGVTTAYLAAANSKAQVYTFEGAGEIAEQAREAFGSLQLSNIQVVQGNFDDTLQPQLNRLQTVDFAFVDGNHRKTPTLQYFHQLLQVSHDSTILIFDDIHWSSEMEEAWADIKAHPATTLTIDLFFVGLVFLRKANKQPEHFTIRF